MVLALCYFLYLFVSLMAKMKVRCTVCSFQLGSLQLGRIVQLKVVDPPTSFQTHWLATSAINCYQVLNSETPVSLMDFLSSVPREKRALRIDLAELRLSNFDRQFALPKWLYIGSIMLTVDL